MVMPRRQDLAGLILHNVGLSTVRNLLLRLQGKPLARFIALHDLPAELGPAFDAALGFLRKRTHVISIEDYFAGKLSDRRVNVVITFDDGYKGWALTAAPLLKRHGLPATFFVSSGFVGLAKAAERDFVEQRLQTKRTTSGCLTRQELRELAAQGFTIGGHTCNHVNMALEADGALLAREIGEDKERLESLTGRKVGYFAYPFGSCHNRKINLIELLRAAGYKGALTTSAGFNAPGSNPYLLKRELTGMPMPLCVFRARVYGACDGVRAVRTGAKRAFGT